MFHVPDTIIPVEETREWVIKNPKCGKLMMQGYKESISDMGNDLLTDSRSSKNTHILNDNFINTPVYFMGFKEEREQGLMIISCLYVFSQYRGKGFARHLVNQTKHIVGNFGAIQISVEEHKIKSLNEFYKKLGFKTTGLVRKNFLGKGYVDYFWRSQEIELIDMPDGTKVRLVNKS